MLQQQVPPDHGETERGESHLFKWASSHRQLIKLWQQYLALPPAAAALNNAGFFGGIQLPLLQKKTKKCPTRSRWTAPTSGSRRRCKALPTSMQQFLLPSRGQSQKRTATLGIEMKDRKPKIAELEMKKSSYSLRWGGMLLLLCWIYSSASKIMTLTS